MTRSMNGRLRLRINKLKIIWMISFLLLLRPMGLISALGISRISRVAQYLVIAFYALVFLKSKQQLDTPIKLYTLYLVWLLLATLLFSDLSSIAECLSVVIVNIAIVLFVNYILHKNIDLALSSLTGIYYSLLLVNLIAILAFPQGLYNLEMYELYERGNWLFGHANTTITYVLPAIFIFIMYFERNTRKKKKRIFAFSGIIIAFANIVLIQSMTSIVGLAIFVIVLCLLKMERGLNLFTLKTGIIISTIVFIAIVIFNAQYRYAYFVENILNRSLTFTSRTTIWSNTIETIKGCWVTGMGYHINTFWQNTIHGSSTHNEFLYCIIQGGYTPCDFLWNFSVRCQNC